MTLDDMRKAQETLSKLNKERRRKHGEYVVVNFDEEQAAQFKETKGYKDIKNKIPE